MATYKFVVSGHAGGGQPWTTSGTVGGGNYLAAHEQVMRETFTQLTQGKAVFGNPGKYGCTGPYRIIEVHIAELMQ